MQSAQRERQRGQAVTPQHFLGDGLGGRLLEVEAVEEPRDQAARLARREARQRRIDRNQGADFGLPRRLPGWIHQLEDAIAPGAHVAVEQVLDVVHDLVGEPGLVEPHHAQRAAALFDGGVVKAQPAPAREAAPQRPQTPAHRVAPGLAHGAGRDAGAAILEAGRQMPEQIADGDDAFLRQRGGALGADARESGDGGCGVDQRRPRRQNSRKRGTPRLYSPARKISFTSPKRTWSPSTNSTGTPVWSLVSLRKVPFEVPISSRRKNFRPRW